MKSTKVKESAQDALNEEENIDKIRDILFGVQVRDIETRFAKLEKRFEEEISKSRAETREQFAKIEEMLEKEVASLSEKIYNEQDSRNASLKELSSDLENASASISKELSGLSEKTASNEAEIRQNLIEQSKSLVALVTEKQKETLASLESKADGLEDSKADRRSLSNAFSEIARLLNEPGEKNGSK
ncbi:MAG: hypothetical protein R2681_08345 [Pyrinomonadaceae bacterium]